MIDIQNLRRTYTRASGETVHALLDFSLCISRGEYVAITGSSGSGKSTLMNILGCLDIPTDGEYILDGENVSHLTDDDLSDIRNRKVGFVFQSFMLLPRITALQNVILPLRYAGAHKINDKAKAALEAVGLGDRMDHRPNELSGGQQQRVAVARALVTNPSILMADEPTGNLDSKSGEEIMELLLKLNRDSGMTLIIVTHSPDVAAQTGRVLRLRDGLLEGGV